MTRQTVFSIFLIAVFLQAGAYGLTFLLPDLFAGFGANEKDVGFALSLTAAATIATVYYSGHLADRFGRVATLAVACLLIAVSLALFGLAANNGFQVVVASLTLGAGWGLTYTLAPVVLTRLVGPDERVRYFALLSVFVMAGFGLSPVLASVLGDLGFAVQDAFLFCGGLCFVSAVLFFVLVKPVQYHSIDKGEESKSGLSIDAVCEIFKSKALIPVVMVGLGASVFAGMNNFQTVFAQERGLPYATYFLAYTLTVILFRVLLVRFKGGRSPYLTIAALQYIMAGSVVLFVFSGGSLNLYVLVAVLFGIGYGASYPILAAMAANDADESLVPQTLQLFALVYFVGIFGFPLIAGWMIVETGTAPLLILVAGLAVVEATLAAKRALGNHLSNLDTIRGESS